MSGSSKFDAEHLVRTESRRRRSVLSHDVQSPKALLPNLVPDDRSGVVQRSHRSDCSRRTVHREANSSTLDVNGPPTCSLGRDSLWPFPKSRDCHNLPVPNNRLIFLNGCAIFLYLASNQSIPMLMHYLAAPVF